VAKTLVVDAREKVLMLAGRRERIFAQNSISALNPV
jgi:hypothetical protein